MIVQAESEGKLLQGDWEVSGLILSEHKDTKDVRLREGCAERAPA